MTRPKPLVLIILDGWGYRAETKANAIALARKPTYDRLLREYPNTLIHTSGPFVGLPEGQMGNSEVGHLNMGAGRIVHMDITRIDELIAGSPNESEILVRTLGGHVGELGEIVHGEAQLAQNEACVVFLQTNPDGIDQVTEMAQGHYPLHTDTSGALRLTASRNMPHLVDAASAPNAAVVRLSGLQLTEARDLIRGARH